MLLVSITRSSLEPNNHSTILNLESDEGETPDAKNVWYL